jgi:hypothetical protein
MTAEEIEQEIAEITLALSNMRKVGQSYEIETGSGKRKLTAVEYDSLVKHRNDLRSQLAEVNGDSGCVLSAGW